MSYDPNTFNISPYYDDFNLSKGFLRVLFKPGYALQARELTQAQTLLQNQISKLGDHLFKDGSRVLGGAISVRNSNYIMIDSGVNSPLGGVTNYSSLVGGYLKSAVANDTTEAKIVHFIPPDVSRDGKLILIIDFISGYQYSGTFNFQKDDTIISDLSVSSNLPYSTRGRCKLVTVTDGIFYIDGFFVRTEKQVFAPYKNESTHRNLEMNNYTDLTQKIGFYINKDNVTEKDDSTLRDPSIGSYNYNAAGADRYTITPTLTQYAVEDTPTDFVELLRFDKGKIIRKIDRISYAEIEKTLARRTFDESGSYTVNPFDITMKESELGPNDSNFKIVVGQGKAYVLGREIENQYPVSVNLPRAQTTKLEGSPSYLTYDYTVGNYIDVKVDLFGSIFSTNLVGIGSGFAFVRFHNSSNQQVALGYVHGMLPNASAGVTSNSYRMYLHGISGSVSSGSSAMIYLTALPPSTSAVAAGRVIPNSGTSFGNVVLNDKQSLVFEVKPAYAVSKFLYCNVVGKMIGGSTNLVTATHNQTTNTTTYTVNKTHFSDSMSSSSASTFNLFNYGTSNNSSDTSEISIVAPTGVAYTLPTSGVTLIGDENEFQIQIFNAAAGFTSGNFKVIAPVVYTPTISDQSTYRTKSLTNKTITFLSNSYSVDSTGRKFFELPDIDIFSVLEIVNNTTTSITYIGDFELDDGQREATYNRGRLYIKPSVANQLRYSSGPAVTIKITYSYFTHSGLAYAPFIGQHSYTNINYEKIPLYTNSRTGKTVSLANCLDFRHSGLTSSTPMIKPYGRSEFGVVGDTKIQYEHYLPRIDKLCLRIDSEDGSPDFFLQSGIPDISPTPPSDPANVLVLSALTVPAFTHNPEDVVITTVDTKRFTMSDIGKIQKRVQDVEVFTKLSISENEIETRSLKTSPTDIEPLKTSIFVDEFYGHSVSDVSSNEHNCSIDFERGELRPFFSTTDIVFPSLTNPAAGSTVDTVISPDGIVTLKYSNRPYIENKSYTKTIKINPTNNVSWLGFMSLSKTIIPKFDKSYRPIVKTNSLMENDNWLSSNTNDARGFGTQWNDWQSIWYGIDDVDMDQDDIQKRVLESPRVSSDSQIPNINSGNVRSFSSRNAKPLNEKTSNYVRARQLKSRIKNKIGSKIVDRSVVPYMSFDSITAKVHGLKPNSNGLYLYFDNNTAAGGVNTDANGSATVTFSIPPGVHPIGSRTVRISDNSELANCEMSADAVIHCAGLVEQSSSGAHSVRPAELRRQTPSSETISKNPFTRDIDSVQNDQWADPLAQTFFVDSKTNSQGLFLKNISLYFSKKDAKLPVVIQIRPTVSGYPSPSVVIPFSTVVTLPENINTNTEYPVPTVMEFSSPVYLEPGEYALCIMANSDDYELYASDTGVNSLLVGDSSFGRAGNSQLIGTLFLPQGMGSSVSEPTTDIMFTLSTCQFVSSGTINFTGVNGCLNSQIIRVGVNEVVPSGCSLVRKIGNYTYESGDEIYVSDLIGTNPDANFTLATANDSVSPVLDLQSLGGVAVKMYTTPSAPVSEYVSRVVELPDAIASNGVSVFVDECTPVGSAISLWYRYSENGETDIFDKPWISLTRSSTTPQFSATSDLDFREALFRSSTLPTNTVFQSYQIKLRMTSSPNSIYDKTPSARNIRAVSFFRP